MENMNKMEDWGLGMDAGMGGDLGAFDFSGAAAPQAAQTQKHDISELLYITGYIASRKNSLTPHFDVEKANKMYKDKFDEIAGGQKTAIYDGKEVKKSFSQTNFKVLFGEGEFEKLKEGNFYKLNVKEGNPEYLVCKSRIAEVEQGGELYRVTREKTAVSDVESKVLLIKPKSLSDILYNTGSKGIVYIKGYVDGVERDLAIFSPQKQPTPDKNGNERIALRYFPMKEDGNFGRFVPQLGVIKGIPHAVNRSFAGDPIEGQIQLSNHKQIEERYPELLDQLNTIGRTLPREVTTGTDQTLPYEDYADVYESLGITPNMLDNLRTSKSSRRDKTYSIGDIIAGFYGEL